MGLLLCVAYLEECLKYVLLLNFEEAPNYDYLIDQLKMAYCNTLSENGEKLST